MEAEVSADLTHIQDEDVLRRMWAETEDFGRKKEIRARMYKLREQRLKDFYTTGEVVTEITGRKHATTTHTESIGDQGFLTMKSKEIRDSESPTRDFSRRANNGYWSTVEERGYTTGTEDGANVERSEETRKGEGLVVEGNTETRMALSAQNLHEKTSKSDDNMSVKSETSKQQQAYSTSSVTDTGDSSTHVEASETQNSQIFKTEKASETSTSSTKISSSSSRRVVSSSVNSSSYHVTGENDKILRDTDIIAITSGDEKSDFVSNLRKNEHSNIREGSLRQTTIHCDDTDYTRTQQNPEFIDETQDFNVIRSSTQRSSKDSEEHQNQSHKTVQNYTTYSKTTENDYSDKHDTNVDKQHTTVIESRSNINDRAKDSVVKNQQHVEEINKINREEELLRNETQIKRDNSDTTEFITNEKIDSSTLKRIKPQSVVRDDTPTSELYTKRNDSEREVSQDTRESSTTYIQKHSNTDQKILNEIQQLDTYLLNQNTPAPSEPVTPKSVTDGAQWTVVSNRDRDGEFVYQNDKTPKDHGHQIPVQPREPIIKHPSSLDLPKDATDGQYVTTYQQSYNRISVDNSPSHEFFVKTLRASPDRLTPSPTKSSRGSLDRNSPDRRLRATSKGSLDRSSPETNKRRSFSKGSLDRSTPERTYRTSPSKTPDRERRGSSGSYTIERKKDARRKTTEITQQTVRDTTNKTKRKFSSTQQKAANKTRVSTPGASPSTSPTRNIPKKEVTSGSESDISQATYNKTSSISSFREENIIISKTENNENIHDSTINKNTATTADRSKPRDKSPEYSSEGSVSREINKNLKSQSEIKTETNSFKPIQQTVTDVTNENFILEEQRNITHEISGELRHSTDRSITTDENITSNSTVRKDITDIEVEGTQDSTDSVCNIVKSKISTEKIATHQQDISENIKRHKSQMHSPEDRPKEFKKPKEDTQPKSSPENKSNAPYSGPKRTTSPEKKPADSSSRQPLRQLNQKRPSDSPSTTLERKPKNSTPTRPSHNERPEHSPSVSPERRQSKSPDRKVQKKIVDENRRSVSKSPERRQSAYKPHGNEPRKIPENENRNLDSSSPERPRPASKSPDKKLQKKPYQDNQRSVSSSPERRQPSSPDRKISPENKEPGRRSSVSSSPERRVTQQKIVTSTTSQETSNRFISEEKKSLTRDRSISSSPERKPLKQSPKPSLKTPEKRFADKSPVSPRQQRPSPSSSPERNDYSPERRITQTRPIQPKREKTPSHQQTPKTTRPTPQAVTQKTITKESIRTTRYSSIPRANKLSPRNSKDKIEPVSKTPAQIIRKPTPIPKIQQITKVSSVTRSTTKVHENKREAPKPAQSRPTDFSRRTLESSPRRTPSKIATPKLTPTKQKTANLLNSTTPVQKATKPGSSPKTPTNKRPSNIPNKSSKITEEIVITENQVLNESLTENTDFLNKERSTLDLVDENPPEEFYDEYDDKTDDTQSPDRQPKTTRTFEDISITINKTEKTAVKQTKSASSNISTPLKGSPKPGKAREPEAKPSNKTQKTRETVVTKKTSRKIKKERKTSKDFGSSSSSSSSEEEETEQNEVIEIEDYEILKNDQACRESNQDLLTVLVQHPKSSRESSPGYPSTAQPFCTTSEDGESNPRYADYISEPDDVEVFDKNRGPTTPIRLTEDDSVDVKSVADRVNVFLEATRVNQETTHQSEVLVSSPKSVLKAKTMFENIAKNQASNKRNENVESRPKSQIEHPIKTHPSNQIQEDVTTTSRLKTSDDLVISEETDITQKTSKTFIEDEIRAQTVNEIKTTSKESSQIPYEAKPNREQPNDKKLPDKKPVGAVIDVTSRKDFFERRSLDEVEVVEEIKNDRKQEVTTEIIDVNTEENTLCKESTPKQKINKQKSPSPQRQLPKASKVAAPDTKKPVDRKFSSTDSAKQERSESTVEVIEIKEQQNLKQTREDSTTKRQNSKTEIISRRSSLKEKSPSPQRNIPKQKEPNDSKKPFERKTSGPSVDVSSKKDFFERKVKDISISAAKTTPRKKDQILPKSSINRPAVETPTKPKVNKQEIHKINPVDSTDESSPSEKKITSELTVEKQEIHEAVTALNQSEEKTRRFSKSEQIVRNISEIDQSDYNLESTSRRHVDNEQPRKTSRPEESKQAKPKQEEITRKHSKPQEIIRKPSKTEDFPKSKQTDETKYHTRSDSYMRSTAASTTRGQSPEKQPEEIVRKLSKPQEIIRSATKSDESSRIKQFDDRQSRTETYVKTTSRTVRGPTPDRHPEEIVRKTSKPEEIVRKPSKTEEPLRRPSSRTESYQKSTITSTARSHTPEYQTTDIIKKSSKIEQSPVTIESTTEEYLNESNQTNRTERVLNEDVEESISRKESYMRSTVSSAGRSQTPEKQSRGSTPDGTRKNRPQSPNKPESLKRKPSETGEVQEDYAMRRTSIRTETKQEVGGKFGVTLRKTPSTSKMTTKPTMQRQNSKPGDTIDIESIFDVELLEEMLLKAVGYDDRRRIRAQIRVAKKRIEDEKNSTLTTKITKTTTSIQSNLPSVRDIKRQTSPSKSPERRESYDRTPHSSPERHGPIHSSPRASPERGIRTKSPEKHSPERSPTRRFSSDKVVTNGYKESRTVTETTTSVRSQTVKKSITSDVKETCPTDLITSSYGVGPTDENGRPLFGLKALRRTSTNKTLIDDTVEHETVREEEEKSSLFGLKALQTENMPAESGQLRELVERHQQYVKESSTKDLQPVQKPKAKLRDSFILTQEQDVTTVLQSGPDDTPKGLSLKTIIQKHENNTGSSVQRSMESKSTVVKSRSTISSDGKVSLHRDVIHGEVSAKNDEEPVGSITRSSYSYQSPKNKDGTPSITSSTTTSLIGDRRNSGPKIEEITDSCTTSDTNRRYSKEYTVQEEETGEERRRSSGVSVDENVKVYTSILKNSNSGRRSSGPRITEVSDVNSDQEERRTSITKTVSSRVSPDIPESKTALSNRFKNEESRTETQKKVLTRGDSVKALQHKFQQATEAANQPTSRPYPRAGLILRSNTLQQIDDQTQMSSSMKHTSVERTNSKSKQEVKETKSIETTSSPIIKTEVSTQNNSQVIKTTQVSRPEEPTSFLDNKTKVTGVQDILTRMRNADLVTEQSDTTEDAEARSLLNKFLGASVILQGMEQGMRAAHARTHTENDGGPTSPTSAALVIQAEKQLKATSGRAVEDDIDDINDEKQLRILLEACSDYEGRRKLRARLRTIMAEQKGGPEDVEESHECSESSSEVVRKGDTIVKTEVHSRTTTSAARLTKANSVQSPFAKFRQLERQNSAPSAGRPPPLFKITEPKLAQSASTIKERLLNWVQAQTRHYKNIKIENFSSSWSNGLAFCALIHHFCPHAFDYDTLTPEKRRYNFELAFRVAEEEADIFPLLDVEDMVLIKKPDWKCVFTYVQSIYRRFHDSPDALPVF